MEDDREEALTETLQLEDEEILEEELAVAV